jgi:HAD superfamily hydrolase (TIGR01490 family)
MAARTGTAIGRVAIFDLDRTLIPGSSLVPLARQLVRRGLVPRYRMAGAIVRNARFARSGADEVSAERLLAEAMITVAGLPTGQLREGVVTAAAEVTRSIRPAMRDVVRNHVVRGDFCVLLSSAPHELVDEVARLADLDLGIGTRVEVRNGLLTGRLDGPFCHGSGKLARLRDELRDLDMTIATAYSDAGSDLPLLEACGQAVAVRPDRLLRAAARKSGWPIVDE